MAPVREVQIDVNRENKAEATSIADVQFNGNLELSKLYLGKLRKELC